MPVSMPAYANTPKKELYMHGGRYQDKVKALLLRELFGKLLLAGRCNIQPHSKSPLLSEP